MAKSGLIPQLSTVGTIVFRGCLTCVKAADTLQYLTHNLDRTESVHRGSQLHLSRLRASIWEDRGRLLCLARGQLVK